MKYSKPILHRQDRILLGAERKSAYIDEKNKLLTAYHEVCLLDELVLIAKSDGRS